MTVKIEDFEVSKIAARIDSGETLKEIANDFGCSPASIYRAFARNGIVLKSRQHLDVNEIRRKAEAMLPARAIDFLIDIIEISIPEKSAAQRNKFALLGFTKQQSAIMAVLNAENGKPISIEKLCYRCDILTDEGLRVQILRCRTKIKEQSLPYVIKTIWGYGYIMEKTE